MFRQTAPEQRNTAAPAIPHAYMTRLAVRLCRAAREAHDGELADAWAGLLQLHLDRHLTTIRAERRLP